MQLKTIGESLTALNIIQGIMNNTTNGARKNFALLKVALAGVSTESVKAAISQTTLTEAQIKTILASKGLKGEILQTTASELAQITATNALTASEAGATTATGGFALAIKGLGASIKALALAHPILTAIAAAGGLFVIGASIYKGVTTSAKEAAEAMQEAQQKIDDAQSKLKTMSDTLSENKDRFLELSQGVGKFSENLSLSEEDYAEYLSISNKLAELFPSLVSGHDDQGNALLAIGENAHETNKKLQALLETQQAVARQTLIDNMDDVAVGIYHQVEDANSSITSMQSELAALEQQYDKINFDIASSKGLLDFSDVDYSKYGKEMEKALTSAGIKFNKEASVLRLVSASPEQLKQAQVFYDAFLSAENDYFHASQNGLKQDIQEKQQFIKDSYIKMNANLQAWIEDNYYYKYLSDNASKLVDTLVPEIKWDELENAPVTGWDYQNYVEENIIKPLMRVPQENKQDIDKMIGELLSFENGDLDVLNVAEKLQTELTKYNVNIDITPIIADEQESSDKLQNSIGAIAEEGSKDYKYLQEYVKDFDAAQAEAWTKVTLGAQNATEAITWYEESLKSVKNTDFLNVSETVDALETKVKPALDSLADAYQDIFTEDGFTKKNINLDMITSIKDEFKELSEMGLGIDMSLVDEFAQVLNNPLSESGDIQAQFDAIANEIINTARCTNVTAEAFDVLANSLEKMGITNAREELINIQKAQEEVTEKGYDLEKITVEEAKAFIDVAENSENAKEYLKYYVFQKELANNPLDTSGDIKALEDLCNKLGISGELYEQVIRLKNAFAAQEAGAIAMDTVISDAKAKIKELAENGGEFNFKFSAPKDSGSGKDSSKEFDWIETAINNIESDIKRLDKTIDSAYTSAGAKSEAFVEKLHKVNEEIKLQQQAYEGYMAKADSVGLSDNYKKLVQSGAINIEKITDEKLADKISEYQQWYEKAQETQDKINDLYEQSSDVHVESYEFEAEQLAKLRDKNLLNMAEYYESMMNLQDEYYNSEALKLKDLADKMEAEYGRMSNINLTRASVTSADMQSAGYTPTVESSSVHAMTFGNEDKQVVVTPILPDGTILSPEALINYATQLLSGEQIDANIQLAMFDGKDAQKQANDYVKGLEDIQGEYAKLKESFAENPYGDFTEQQLEAMEKLSEELDKILEQHSNELGEIKSAYDNLSEIRDTYNEYGKISVDQYQELCDMGYEYLAFLSDENGALSLDEDAFQRLTDAKIRDIQVDMALQAIDMLNKIQSEEDAVNALAEAYGNLANNAMSAAEARLYKMQADMHAKGVEQGKYADFVVNQYEKIKSLGVGVVDVKMQSGGGYKENEKEKETIEEEIIDWTEKYLENIEKVLDKTSKFVEKISDKTSKLIDKVEKFFSWQKKNAMLNRAVKSTNNEINAAKEQIDEIIKAIKKVKTVLNVYTQKLSEIELPQEYIDKIKNGELEIETITYKKSNDNENSNDKKKTNKDPNEELVENIEAYKEWYEKIEDCEEKMEDYEDSIQDCRNTINDLYDQQRDLIRQKLDNVLNYYSDMDSYLTSITSKMESLISLNDAMGKRSSLTELVEQFAEVSDRLSATVEKSLEKSVTEIDLGESESVKKAQAEDRQELVDSIQSEIDNLAITDKTSGTYKKLLDKIDKKEKQIQKYEDKGWDTKKTKKYAKLQKELEDYYELRKELEENTTSDTITNYNRIYKAWQKLQNKIDNGKILTKSQQKKYDSYLAQMEQLKADKDAILAELDTELDVAKGEITTSEADKAQKALDSFKSELEDTATYKKLTSNIEKAENELAELEKIGYENLTNKQKKTHKKLLSDLEKYYAKKEAFDEGTTASNILQYNKIYNAWRKLQNRLDKGKNLSVEEWTKYNDYTKQLEEFNSSKADTLENLESQLDAALNPGDKLDVINREYEKASKDMYESYQKQIDNITYDVADTELYKNMYAESQRLEKKKDKKGLTKDEQALLDKYNAELDALIKGGTKDNISEYMSIWEEWYALQRKLDKKGTLSGDDAKKYDEYKAKLEAWNKEKQTQIDDLVSLMEDDLAALQKTYTENVAEAESQINDYYANLYDYAKQIAEYNLTTLETELSLIEACLSYYKELVSLHDNFSGNKLSNLMADLDIDDTSSQEELYEQYINELQNKYDTTLKKINEYKQLITAAESEDYEGALTVLKNQLDEYTKNGETDKAKELQNIIGFLNERAVDANNWGESADLWLNEWEEALASAKTELIGIATNIQEVNDALREVKFSNITDAVTQLNNAQDVLSSIGDLINDDWVYDADGNLTQYGITKVGLLVEEINSAKQEVSKYAQLMKSIQEMQDTYASDEAYQTALQEAKMNYLTSLNDLQNYQDSVVAILTKADESIINSLKEVIAKRKEALQKQKELYDYGKNLKNSQKEIDAIQAQIDALRSLSGAMDSATKAKLAQLEADLAEKQEALQETKDDHTYNLQIDALDKFLEDLDSTMSDTADSVNKSFETYIEAINSALDVYEANKEHLNEWSNDIIKATMRLTGDSFDNVSLKVDGADSGNETIDNPTVSVVSSDTVNAIESTGATTNQKLDNIQNLLQTTVNGGVLVRVADSPLLTVNPEMMRLLNSYIPPIAMNVQQHLPQLASKNNQTVVNVHYDNLLTVNGNVDKDFAKVLPQHLEQAYEYTTKRLYKELNISR